jgi:hypothetical protein
MVKGSYANFKIPIPLTMLMRVNAFPQLLWDPEYSKHLEMFRDCPADIRGVEFSLETHPGWIEGRLKSSRVFGSGLEPHDDTHDDSGEIVLQRTEQKVRRQVN